MLDVKRIKEIEEMKKNFYSKHNITDNDILCDFVGTIRNKLDIEVKSINFSDGMEGVLIVDKNGELTKDKRACKKIGVNINSDYYTQRFTIAHELAHYIINEDKNIIAFRDHSTKNENVNKFEEDKADYLAASILIPCDEFKKDLLKLQTYPDNIKYDFLQKKYRVAYRTITCRELEMMELNSAK